MSFEGVEVGNLGALEVRAEHCAGVFPGGAVGSEDSFSEEGNKAISPELGNLKIGELQGQDGLDILGFTGRDDWFEVSPRKTEKMGKRILIFFLKKKGKIGNTPSLPMSFSFTVFP